MTAGDELRTSEVDGVRVLWTDTPGPLRGGLVFRVGSADERLVDHGLTHLVEHLAFDGLELDGLVGGAVELTTTWVAVSGGEERVARLLERMCRNLSEPPTDRLDVERRVLDAEEGGLLPGPERVLLSLRFGARGPGILAHDELGVWAADAAAVRGWAARWMTRDNAVAWFTGPPPAGLRLPLPDGPARPAVLPTPLRRLQLPAEQPCELSGVALGALAEGDDVGSASAALAGVLERRATRVLRRTYGVSYTPKAGAPLCTLGARPIVLRADCADEDAAFVRDQLLRLWSDVARGVDVAEDLEARAERARLLALEPEYAREWPRFAAARLLLGAEPLTLGDTSERTASVPAGEVAALAAALLDTVIAAVPYGVRSGYLGPRLPAALVVAGTRHRVRPDGGTLHVGEEGVSHVGRDGKASTVLFEELAAAVRHRDRVLELVGLDGTAITVPAEGLSEGAGVRTFIADRVPSGLVVHRQRDGAPWRRATSSTSTAGGVPTTWSS